MSVSAKGFVMLSERELEEFAAAQARSLGVAVPSDLMAEIVANLLSLQGHARLFLASPLAGEPERTGGG